MRPILDAQGRIVPVVAEFQLADGTPYMRQHIQRSEPMPEHVVTEGTRVHVRVGTGSPIMLASAAGIPQADFVYRESQGTYFFPFVKIPETAPSQEPEAAAVN
jgi:hypothetical protein